MADPASQFDRLLAENPDLEIPDLSKAWSVQLAEAVTCLAAAQSILAAGTIEDAITVLQDADGAVSAELPGHDGGTNSLVLTPAKVLVSAGEDGKARVWDLESGSCSHELVVDGADPDRTPSGHSVGHVALAPGAGGFGVAAGRTITLFSLPPGPGQEGTPERDQLPALPSTVEALRFRGGTAPGKPPLLLAAYHGGVTIWNLGRRPEDKQALDLPYSGACLAADVSDDMAWIVAGCHDATVHIYNIIWEKDGVSVEEMTCGGYDGKVTLVDFSPCGRQLASSGGSRATIWDFSRSPNGSIPVITVGHSRTITAQAWQPRRGGLLATGGRDGRVLVYDLDLAMPGQPRICLPVGMADTKGDEVTALAWAQGGEALVSGHVSGQVRCWTLPPLEAFLEEQEQGAAAEPADRD